MIYVKAVVRHLLVLVGFGLLGPAWAQDEAGQPQRLQAITHYACSSYVVQVDADTLTLRAVMVLMSGSADFVVQGLPYEAKYDQRAYNQADPNPEPCPKTHLRRQN